MILNGFEIGRFNDYARHCHDFTVTIQDVHNLLDTISAKDTQIEQLQAQLETCRDALMQCDCSCRIGKKCLRCEALEAME